MADSKHTPGPWSSGEMNSSVGLPFAPVIANTLIAKVYSTAFKDDEQAVANAKLMAAAPDMLDALKKIEDAALHGFLTPELCAKIVLGALDKAEGRS